MSVAALIKSAEQDGVQATELCGLPLLTPPTEEQLVSVLKSAHAARQRIVPCGAGTKLAWCRPEILEEPAPVLLSTAKLQEIVSYEPGDGTLTAQAGCTFVQLADTIAAGGHRLTPDLPRSLGTTLAGAIAAAQSGPDRMRYGPLRHHVLGLRVALADGTLSKSGGRLVKNVTGFDLHRLHTGGRGTLGVILEASLRLFPLPDAEMALRLELAHLAEATACAAAVRRLPLNPHALLMETQIDGKGVAPWTLTLALSGRREQLLWELEQCQAVLPSARVLQDQAAQEERARCVELALRDGRWPALRLGSPPSAMPRALAALLDWCATHAVNAAVVAQPAVAQVEVFWTADAHPSAEQLCALQAALTTAGATMAPVALPPETVRALQAARPAHAGADWMQRLRAAFDPMSLLSSPYWPGSAQAGHTPPLRP